MLWSALLYCWQACLSRVYQRKMGWETNMPALHRHFARGWNTAKYTPSTGRGAQIGYAFTLSPGKSAVAAVGFGRSMYGRKTLTEIVATAQSQGINVLGGINGDAFAVQTGLPLSCMISQGEILAANTDGELCFGVDQNGQAIIGSPQIFFNITAGEKASPLNYTINCPKKRAGPGFAKF